MNRSAERDGAALVWFRDDLRLADNPALDAAVRSGRPLLALYMLDEDTPGLRPLGAAARWWLHGSLDALARSLAERGVPLVLRRGAAAHVVPAAASEAGAALAFWNRRYGGAEISADEAVAQALRTAGVESGTFNGRLLHEPHEIRTGSGAPFRVFTPYWRAALRRGQPRAPLPAPSGRLAAAPELGGDRLADWRLEPTAPDWAGGIRATWTRGEAGAEARLAAFVAGALGGYAEDRNRPDRAGTSMLSPHLRFGELSPVQLWHALAAADGQRSAPAREGDLERFRFEIGWREFSHHVLGQFPALAAEPLQPRFEAFPFRRDPAGLSAWRRGLTGYPIVDAGMRQLWRTGWMHNRVRLIAASFLAKHLLIDWRDGEAWFWDTLCDADPANNAASWQWVVGSGMDAAPFFRIFNPVLQGQKFDPAGDYVRRFVPELARLPARWIHAPWSASPEILEEAGVRIGATYPAPIVEHAAARARALAAFRALPSPDATSTAAAAGRGCGQAGR